MYSKKLETELDQLSHSSFELQKKKMFGGLGYLYKGHMVVGVYKDYLIIRVGSAQLDDLLQTYAFIEPANIMGKIMRGWGMVEQSQCTPELIEKLTQKCIDFVMGLPGKPTLDRA